MRETETITTVSEDTLSIDLSLLLCFVVLRYCSSEWKLIFCCSFAILVLLSKILAMASRSGYRSFLFPRSIVAVSQPVYLAGISISQTGTCTLLDQCIYCTLRTFCNAQHIMIALTYICPRVLVCTISFSSRRPLAHVAASSHTTSSFRREGRSSSAFPLSLCQP